MPVLLVLVPWLMAVAAATAPPADVVLPACTAPLPAVRPNPGGVGEALRYGISMGGVQVGRVEFRVEQDSTHQGIPVREYRSQFNIDPLVATLVALHGQAAALVPYGHSWPRVTMSRYRMDRLSVEERGVFDAGGQHLDLHRRRGGQSFDEVRHFSGPVHDFITGFYLLRRLPPGARGCLMLWGNQHLYTAWLEPGELAMVSTPVGPRPARHYAVRYQADRGGLLTQGDVWVAETEPYLPYRCALRGRRPMLATLERYDPPTVTKP